MTFIIWCFIVYRLICLDLQATRDEWSVQVSTVKLAPLWEAFIVEFIVEFIILYHIIFQHITLFIIAFEQGFPKWFDLACQMFPVKEKQKNDRKCYYSWTIHLFFYTGHSGLPYVPFSHLNMCLLLAVVHHKVLTKFTPKKRFRWPWTR